MNYLRVGFGVVVLVLAVFAWGQHRQLGLQGQLLQNQQSAIDAVVDNLNTVVGLSEQSRDQMADLLSAQSNVSSVLSARQQEIRRLQNDVAEIRTWADQPLPADIVRMRQRPAARGAGDYGKSMPAGGSVRPAGGSAQDERGNEPDGGTR